MSLRDQLLKKGLASKKDARRVDQAARKQRKHEEGNARRKKALKREREAAEAAEKAAELEKRLRERAEREAARDRYEHALRVRNLVLGNRTTNRGDHRFFFRAEDKTTVREMRVQKPVAEALANGTLAIAWLDQGTRVDYVLINAAAAAKLHEADAEHIVLHWATGARADHEQLLERDWDPSLRAHRQR